MTKILVFSDFDGTITGRAGKETVFCPFYESLMVDAKTKKSPDDYHSPAFKKPHELQSIFEIKFGKYDTSFNYNQPDADLLMSADTVAFFKAALNTPEVTINIISKNRKDYIYALFRYHGFTEDEISRLLIDDSGWKAVAVYQSLTLPENISNKPSCLYILDDSSVDFEQMVSTAKNPMFGFLPEQIKEYNKQPGQFDWKQYHCDIQELLAPSLEHQSTIPLALAIDSLALTEDKVIPALNVSLSAPFDAVLQEKVSNDSDQAIETDTQEKQRTTGDSTQYLKDLGGPVPSSTVNSDIPVVHYPSPLQRTPLSKSGTIEQDFIQHTTIPQ